jgi:hypothetical protein
MSTLFGHYYRRFHQWIYGISRRGSAPTRSHRVYLKVDQLEDRVTPAVYKVNTLADLSLAPGVDNATGRIDGTNTVTLRSAIFAANHTVGSNTIELTVPGVYKIAIPPAGTDDTMSGEDDSTGDFDIIPNAANTKESTLTIMNASGGKVAVDGNHLDRVFDINPNDAALAKAFTVVLDGFTIQNGIASPGDLAAGSGGGIRDQGNVNLTLTNMVVTGNRATADGGGLVMLNSVDGTWKLTITHSTISNNHAGDAGGGIDTDGAGTVVITDSVISGNTDVNQGAGVYIDLAVGASPGAPGADMTMTRTIVGNNQALASSMTDGQGGSGGGISNAGTGAMTIISSTIANNFAAGSGGGFDDENGVGTLNIQTSLFLNNAAALDGGAIREGGTSSAITSSEIKGNVSGQAGGGVFANGVTLTVMASTIANNISTGNGGGLELQTTGSGTTGSTLTDVTITGNSALNNAGVNGGGIDAPAAFTGSMALVNDTINANFADNGGGIFWAATSGSTFSLQNTIVAQNVASTAGPDAVNLAGMFTDNDGNLIGISGAGSGNTGFAAVHTQTGSTSAPLDPLLGPLQNNRGPTVGAPGASLVLETEAPLKNSPAIGKGILTGAPPTDERGFPSVQHGKINVGAVSQAKRRT